MFAIWKKEFKAYFHSVIGWLFVAALLALFGLYFYAYNLMQGYPYVYYSLSSVTIIFLIAVPVLTMRSFAEERKNRTDQLMLTAPVSVGKIVLGKYLAMVSVFSVDVLLFCFAPLILRAFGTVPMGESYISILAFWLYGCACIAVGMLISALTESQVIAAVLSFAVLFISYMMQGITGLISSDGNWLTEILNCLDLYAPFDKFAGGCLDLTAIVYYVSVIAFLNFLTVQSIQKRRFCMSRKKLSTGVFSIGMIVVSLAATVGVNVGVNAIPSNKTAIDCSYSKLYSIMDDTKKVLKNLDQDVTIYALVAKSNKDVQVDEILSRYKDMSKHIKVKYINPSSKPYFYQDYTDVEPTSNSLIVVSDARSRVIDYYDIYQYETSYTNELTGFDAEGQLTSAISYVTMDAEKLPVVYQITGHDESGLGSAFKDAVTKANMTLSSVELLNEESVPADAAAIIINAPQTDFNKADAEKVIDYLEAGGKAIIVGAYTNTPLPNFESVLKKYEVEFAPGIIAENDAQHYYTMGGPLYLLSDVNSTAYTESMGGNYIYIPATLGITYPDSTDDVTYTSLVDTTEDAVAKANPDQMQDYGYEDGDVKGPFSVGLAVEKQIDDENTMQMLVFGTPYVFGDEASQLTGNNAVLFEDAISALVPQTNAEASVIPAKSYSLDRLTVNALFAVLLGLTFILFVPLILIIVGIVIFAVRRKK
ncbi:MAG: Gldg family protein [Lachnospiraceae bacterium]|nr:Gldg family protein [Lachnospiraceae bacterium]